MLKIKKAIIEDINGPPKNVQEARNWYRNGSEMVRYHVVYMLAKDFSDWETVEFAAENDTSELVREMAKSILRNKS